MTVQSNVNVTASDTYLDYKFANLVKGGQRIITNGGPINWYDDTFLNDDCYPIETTYGINFSVNVQATTYVVRWQGSGSVTCPNMTSKSDASSGIYTGGGSS